MNKKPVMLRTIIAAVVILIFAISTYPLAERDFYETFTSMVKGDKKEAAKELAVKAIEVQKKDSNVYPSQALLDVANNQGVELKTLVPENKSIEDNRDVIGAIRKKASSSIRLGLDLAGGVEFIIELIPDEEFIKKADAIKDSAESKEDTKKRLENEFERYRDMAIEILRKRLEANKIYEAEITPTGSKFITLKAPIVSKDEKVKLLNLIQMSAKLRFRLVHENNAALVQQYLADKANFTPPIGYELMSSSTFRQGNTPVVEYYIIENRAQMDGKGIVNAMPTRDQFGQRAISLRFDNEGAKKFRVVSGNNIGRQLAIVLDGKLYCAPTIKSEIGGEASISGQFSNEELTNISNALVSGGFPFQIKVDAVFDTDPKLGAESVKNGIFAGIGALLLVVIFMIFYYKTAGLIAVTALGINVVLVLGALSAFDATLTLPGIAGIVLTIGMAVDANVLIFERIREELSKGKGLITAINLGYEKAFSAVLDANITTLFIAVILMYVGTGAVKGFAVSLAIGIVTSLFTALFLTRLVFDYAVRFFNLKSLTMRLFLKQTNYDFLKCAKRTTIISIVLMLISVGAFILKGTDMLSVDFTGGTLVNFSYEQKISPQKVEDALKTAGIAATVSYKSNASSVDNQKVEVLVRNSSQDDVSMESIEKILNEKFIEFKLANGNESRVGGLVGWEFSKSAIWAVFLSFIGIIIYVSMRYEFSYAMAGILALFHDVIVASGVFVIMGREFSLPVIAALLTIIGYSINDTIVIFDRIRENVSLNPTLPYRDVVNSSINDTLNRTILTSLTTLFVVVILFFFGGIAINDFVLVMLLGIIIGTYSSIFIASPIVAVWHKKIGK